MILTPSLSEGQLAMRKIPTPISWVQSSETPGSHPMPWPPVDNPLPEGEEEDIIAEEVLAAKASRAYLRWDGSNWLQRGRVDAQDPEQGGASSRLLFSFTAPTLSFHCTDHLILKLHSPALLPPSSLHYMRPPSASIRVYPSSHISTTI
ncbi:hypothetical protein PIB30_047848 [Stylosanthes scabra]|uniref:Uncharacterized protein n=1 Tax=Stylosanthes scabra TaxID=79078 RepID=A0ABU6TJ07_9FABA|nr:hypothetical protein [Stylosanthes scabra]